MYQVSLFSNLENKPTEKPIFSEPVPYGGYMSIHGLIYSLAPVEGWLDVKCLCIYRPPGQQVIADRAWVDPDTINIAYCQDYKEHIKQLGIKITPLAWGFGPEVKISRHEYEMASFDFANYEDYLWVEEKFLKPKREERNRNFVKGGAQFKEIPPAKAGSVI